MYGEEIVGNLTDSHDFVNEFVDLPPHSEPLGYFQPETSHDQQSVDLQEIFYSPMLSAAPGSAEQTPLMTPSDQSFVIPPSYFSPSMSPPMNARDIPDFELPKKAVATSSGGRVRKKQPSQRRKWNVSRNSSTSSSAAQSRNNSTASPHSGDEEQQQHGSAVTPASLMNVSVLQQDQHEVESRLNEALMATQRVNSDAADHRRFSSTSQSSQSSAITPAIRPRSSVHSTNSAAIAPYLSPAIAPNDVEMANMLASKSNYQNIVDGKHQQLGLQYPDRLTTDITNKKACHKIAEQERRNRINVAITELGRLVTPEIQMNSKAATVEAAIVYIKELQAENTRLRDNAGVKNEL